MENKTMATTGSNTKKSVNNNKIEEDASFDVFKSKKTIRLTADGGVLKEIITQGKGQRPSEGSACDIHYVGRMKDGTIFDSSRKRKKPFRFVLGEESVIRGFNIAVRTMSGLERSKVVITPAYAYGPEGNGTKIPPNATLIFDMELVCWYSDPTHCPDVKSDPEPLTVRLKKERALKRRMERLDALTNEEDRIKSLYARYESALLSQVAGLVKPAVEAKSRGNVHFKAEIFDKALLAYGDALRYLDDARASVPSASPAVLHPPPPPSNGEDLASSDEKVSGNVALDSKFDIVVRSAADVISLTVEEATLTKEVKERLSRLEGTSSTGDVAAKIHPIKANALIHERMSEKLREDALSKIGELKAALLTNSSACLFRLKRFKDSAAKASAALESDPFHKKALYRRSMARASLEKSVLSIEGSLDDMAMSIMSSAKATSAMRLRMFDLAIRSTPDFAELHGCTIECRTRSDDSDDGGSVKDRSCVAKKRFAPGDILWRETCFVSRCSEVADMSIVYTDALRTLLASRKTTSGRAKFATTVGRMLALRPLRSFVERRSDELRSKRKQRGTASAAASWIATLVEERGSSEYLKASVVQRIIWDMDDASKTFLKTLLDPLDLSWAIRLLFEVFATNVHKMAIGGFGLGFHASVINHSCWPNVDVHIVEPGVGVVVRAVREIAPGDEISLSYIALHNLKRDRMTALYRRYGFVCRCPRCAGEKYDGRSAALIEVDESPYAAKGSKDDIEDHHRLFEERLERIQVNCHRMIARGNERKGREDSLKAIREWLNDTKHFFAPHHPERYQALRLAANQCFVLLHLEEALTYIRECDEISSRVHPSHWPWGRDSLWIPREVALRALGKKHHLEEAERCRQQREALFRVHSASSKLWVSCGCERDRRCAEEVGAILASRPDVALPETLREEISRIDSFHALFLATRKRTLARQRGEHPGE